MPLNEFFNRLFSFGKARFTCSEIHRPEKFITAYQNWLDAQVYLNWTGPFFKAYHFQKCKIASPKLRVQIIEETNRQGVILFNDPSIGKQNFTFLFELLKDRVIELGYRVHASHIKKINHERYHEQIERYALIPPASDVPSTNLCNQLYGNIHLDLVSVNKEPGYIRLMANTYTDAYFSEPLPFMQLISFLLQHKTV